MQAQHVLARVSAPDLPFPPEKRPPFGWHLVPVQGTLGTPTELTWPEPWPSAAPARLRITIGLGFRECRRILVHARRTGVPLGEFDLRFVPALQPCEILLSVPQAAEAACHGVTLQSAESGEPLWMLAPGGPAPLPPLLAPHLFGGEGDHDPLPAFLARMDSLACIQPFGWTEGCILEGLLDLDGLLPQRCFGRTAQLHLRQFLNDDGTLQFECAHGRPLVDRLETIEETLMFAAIARLAPAHPALGVAERFWQKRMDDQGQIADGTMISAEACYTVAYPLAVIAQLRGNAIYADWALRELRLRQAHLRVGDDIVLRSYADGRKTFPNWSRGVAWYLLGLARTLGVLGPRADTEDLQTELQRGAAWALARRTEQHLWNGFLGDPTTPPDTAGSAGIAAALAYGAAHHLLAAPAAAAAREAVAALCTYLTPDGLLTGVSQSNCGGEGLQRSTYRVIFPMGMGLLAQAWAWSLDPAPARTT